MSLFSLIYKYFPINKILFLIVFFLISSFYAKAQTKVVQDTVIQFYTVQMGENLYTISFKFKVSKELICKVNNCKTYSDLKLITGNKIKIPKIVNRTIILNDSILAFEKYERDIYIRDSLDNFKLYMQQKEDSLFLIYLELDKKRDSIDKYQQIESEKVELSKQLENEQKNIINNDITLIENNKKQIQDSIKNYKLAIVIQAKIKDSVELYNNKLIAKQLDSLKTYESNLELNQLIKDSIEFYTSNIKEIKKQQEDSIATYQAELIAINKSQDSLINYQTDSMIQVLMEISNAKSIEDIQLQSAQNDSIKYYFQYIDSLNIYTKQNQQNQIKDSIYAYKKNRQANKVKVIQDTTNSENKIAEKIIPDTTTKKIVAINRSKLNKSNISYTVIDDTMIVINDTSYLLTNMKKATYTNKTKDTAVVHNISNIEHTSKIKDTSSMNSKENPEDLSVVEVKENKKKKKYKIGDKIPDSDIQKSDFYLSRAMKAIDNKEYDNAQLFIKKAININPNNTEAYILLGDMFASFNYFDKAAKEYSKAIQTDDRMPVLYYNRGVTYLKMNELTKSLLDFNAAVNLDSQYVLAIGGRAAILLLRKNYQLAIQDYSKIIELNPFFAPAYKARAEAYIAVGSFKNAISDCDNFIETNPNDAYIYYQRGMAKIKDGEFYQSCIDLLKSSELGYIDAKIALKKFCK